MTVGGKPGWGRVGQLGWAGGREDDLEGYSNDVPPGQWRGRSGRQAGR